MRTTVPDRASRFAMLVLLALSLAACSSSGQRSGAGSAGSGLNLSADCQQTEADGFEENAQVVVSNNRVTTLNWRMRMGRKGTCTFAGTDFRQTRTKPNIELTAKNGSGCRLFMWSDPRTRRVTLAHNSCATFCTKGVYDKAWPVMFDPRTGGCADNSK